MFGEELRKYVQTQPAWVDLVAQVTQHPDRPRPVRRVDQIFMLPGSQLIQALLVSDYLKYRDGRGWRLHGTGDGAPSQ